MTRLHKLTLPLILVAALSGCGTTRVAPAAQAVRIISEEQAKACTFIDSISTNNESSLARNPELDARNKALNKTAQRGGNAFLVKTALMNPAPSGVGAFFSMSGEAYRCPL